MTDRKRYYRPEALANSVEPAQRRGVDINKPVKGRKKGIGDLYGIVKEIDETGLATLEGGTPIHVDHLTGFFKDFDGKKQ